MSAIESLVTQTVPNLPRTDFIAGRGIALFGQPGSVKSAADGVAAVVSSRIGQRIDREREWLNALRGGIADIKQTGMTLMVTYKTTAWRLLLHAGLRERMAVLFLVCRGERVTSRTELAYWIRKTARGPGCGVLVSGTTHSSNRDELASELASTIYALRVRVGGRILGILRRRLGEPTDRGCVRIPEPNDGTAGWAALKGSGAVSFPTGSGPVHREHSLPRPGPPRKACLNGPWLVHCTRAGAGKWPGQSIECYYDGLLDGTEDSNRDPEQSLARILLERKLRRSSLAIRGGFEVVCFTERTPRELAAMRKYQRHQTRWDFEPYGIAVARQRARQFGCRPVEYHRRGSWNDIRDDRRPWYQFQGDGVNIGRWTSEREWRCLGDLQLDRFSSTELVAFVGTEREQQRVARVSRWPVLTLHEFALIDSETRPDRSVGGVDRRA